MKGKGNKERVVIVGRPASEAMAEYLQWARPQLLAEGREPLPYGEDPLLLNRYGARLSKRSIEKIVASTRKPCRHTAGSTPPHPEAHFCHPLDGWRGRYPSGAGVTGTCIPHDHSDLHARYAEPSATGVHVLASSRTAGVASYVPLSAHQWAEPQFPWAGVITGLLRVDGSARH